MVYPQEQKQTSGNTTCEASTSHGTLRPITSVTTERYNKYSSVELSNLIIPAGLGRFDRQSTPTYLPESWASYVHPEGQLYFCRHSTPVIVTEAYLYNSENMQKMSFWLKWIEVLCEERQIAIHPGVELFIQLEESGCAYYFVDHLSRTEFWLDQFDTDDMGLPQVASEEHLKLALNEHYWSHVEYFPAHFGGLEEFTVNELISIFSHATLDRMTSAVSTFPYTPKDCRKYIDLLKNAREDTQDMYNVCVIARLWVLIMNHRFTTHHGQESSRLSRTQSILAPKIYTPNFVSRAITRLTLGLSDVYTSKLDDVFVDDLVYTEQWHELMQSNTKDWKASLQISTLLLFAHIVHCIIPGVPSLGLASAIILFTSVLSASLLLIQHRHLLDTTALHAADHLLAIRSQKYGFKITGMLFALPAVLNTYGAALFLAHGLTLVALRLHPGVAAGIALFIALFAWCAHRMVAPRQFAYTTEKCEV
ncbi:hypothetical protein PC9H_008560 [Pleurotus ostreatus]|uniref:WW domain-containing protein n=1 Tax=Pleurotus ostreatus TaxID=5322 RepID=A0A8H6ZP54_PLEOS|nr:uncharacterized protein PC9H_008560 [Pleurotus ostreatus]KAF7426193.1 hypothetical protein PC9H_008560 [Pleurotus ostreatus]KAJ8693649.1 hypothetical protein PTI98_008629 [Pleurotus ostreatus]